MKQLITTLLFLSSLLPFAQNPNLIQNDFSQNFKTAYQLYPNIPNGMLEAISFTQTRFKHISMFEQESCSGLPKSIGIMGLTLDGKNYFRENLKLVSSLSGYSESNIISNPESQLIAYAAAYSALMDSSALDMSEIENHKDILIQLSELPIDHNIYNNFAINCHLYSVFIFLNSSDFQQFYGFPNHNIDMVEIFGQDNLNVLSSNRVNFDSNAISNVNGIQFRSTEYAPAIWTAAPTCNYSSRNGTPVSAITIHTIQGSYAGAISWSQNCNSNVSYHYVIRSVDGQVTQMVLEADKGWHVGSANPYTIGYEHEGYVSDASWYTSYMIESSADLSRDIVNSGYGINPLRTYYGASSSGTNTLGNCTKIKGHQHYANQTHTDPGINWDWENYYQLINNVPTINTVTAGSGNLYDTGGPTGNYMDDERELVLIQPSNASSVTITFNAFEIEQDWDYLFIYDGATTSSPIIGVYTGTNSPGTITSSTGSLLIEFRSDCATNNPGYEISYTSATSAILTDSIPPTSSQTNYINWATTNFNQVFSDTDNTNGSGIDKGFYLVSDYDNTVWSANTSKGFYLDNFEAITTNWTNQVGTWSANNTLIQSDETEGNTNIWAVLNQNNSDAYLYHWSGKISGSGNNKRGGFHFFCDDATQTDRGNSYFVFFRTDNNKIQIYKVVNNTYSLEVDEPFTINENQWYDCKVIFDKITGKIAVFLDNNLSATWTDPTPFSANGDYISFRSGNSNYEVDNLKIYKQKTTNTTTISVGINEDIRYQNPNPLTPAGNIRSISLDLAGNLSSVSSEDINVDWTAPLDVTYVNDGDTIDIDTTYDNTELSANWDLSLDQHSDISRYLYAIGTTPGATDVLNWTDNWFNNSVTQTGLNLIYGTTYYFSVVAENGAGLLSTAVNSDGQFLAQPTAVPNANFTVQNASICITDSISVTNNSNNATSYSWSFPGGSPSSSTDINPYVSYANSGTYNILLTATGPAGVDTISQNITINISNEPTSSFTASDTTVDVANGFVGFTNNAQNANGYFWDFGDGNTSTDVSPWHIFTQPGSYNIMCIAINGVCENDTTWQTIYVSNINGIKDLNNEYSISLFPNPTSNISYLTINSSINELASIELFDVTGKLIKSISQQIVLGENRIEINQRKLNLEKGIYFIKTCINNSSKTMKLVIE